MDVREKLVKLLDEYFDIGDSYAYNLTRVKSAFACGTMGFDDFEEFDEETVADIADHLIANGVTVQEWISVKDRLPKPGEKVLTYRQAAGDNYSKITIDYIFVNEGEPWWSCDVGTWKTVATHWMPLPQPPKGE